MQHGGHGGPHQPTNADEVRSLWIGNLLPWMDETYLNTCFAHTGQVDSVTVIRYKQTSESKGYGFIEFTSRAGAERILHLYNGGIMPNSYMKFKIKWAHCSFDKRRRDGSPEYSIYVGNLAADVTDYHLLEMFRTHYSSVKRVRVVIDCLTGRTRGYGFVRFADESEQIRAMTEMEGVLLSSRAMRVRPATIMIKAPYQNSQGAQNENDPNNTTIYVGNLDHNVTADNLRQVFGQFGELVYVNIPSRVECGFVKFADRSCAERARHALNGTLIGEKNVRLSWSRKRSKKQRQADPNQWNGGGGYYGYGQGYENYGYALPPAGQDPNMYETYPGIYPIYQPP